MNSPMISVVMSVYNGEKYLKEAIDSILSQTYTDYEFIIIDDASTDKSLEIISSYYDQRIVLVQNGVNLGLTKSLNKGIRLATGKYIARMDSDDISLPLRLEKQVLFMQQHPDIDICGTWYTTFGEQKYLQKLPLTHEQIKADLLFYTPMAHPTILMKKDIFKKYQYPENFLKAQDYALWTQLIDHYRFSNIPNCLLLYRLHSNQAGVIDNIVQFNSAKIALNIFLKSAGIESIQEIHYHLWQQKVMPLQEVGNWLIYLKNVNSKNKTFDDAALDNTLFNQWWIMNNLQSTFNLRSLLHFYASSLYMPKRLSLISHLKFFIKSLIFYKRS